MIKTWTFCKIYLNVCILCSYNTVEQLKRYVREILTFKRKNKFTVSATTSILYFVQCAFCNQCLLFIGCLIRKRMEKYSSNYIISSTETQIKPCFPFQATPNRTINKFLHFVIKLTIKIYILRACSCTM